MILDYWGTWIWDFPHIAVGLMEFILAFNFTHYATDPRPSVWKQPTNPRVKQEESAPLRDDNHCVDCGWPIRSGVRYRDGHRCLACTKKVIEAKGRIYRDDKVRPVLIESGLTEEQHKRARIDPAIDDRMLWRGNNTMGYTQVEIPDDWRQTMKRKEALYLNRWQVTDD